MLYLTPIVEQQRKRRLDAHAAVPDEDGFITVTRQTKRSRNIDVGTGASCSSRKTQSSHDTLTKLPTALELTLRPLRRPRPRN